MNKLNVNIGDKFGRLSVISEIEKRVLPSGQKIRQFKCKCDCGKETNVLLLHLIRSRILSCGCISKTKNGEGNSPLCKVWRGMIYRCSNKNHEKHLYLLKGIKVCDDWKENWESFKKWSEENGYKKGLQIDRIDNSKGYSPDNCRWVEPYINVNNRDITLMVEYNGKIQSLSIVLRHLNKSSFYYTIRNRIKRGWSAQDAIDTPIKIGNYKRKTKQI